MDGITSGVYCIVMEQVKKYHYYGMQCLRGYDHTYCIDVDKTMNDKDIKLLLWCLVAVVVGIVMTIGIIGVWEGVYNLLRN